tara:strand:- start:122 stop:973 length:852 start_codon:yes stop_codon:yes gene_type:complete
MNGISIQELEGILGRKQYSKITNLDTSFLEEKKVLITGANGSIGIRLVDKLKNNEKINILATDIFGDFEYLDVTDRENVKNTINKFDPDYVVNLAGAKHAPEGEVDTFKTFSINTLGTKYLLESINKKTKFLLTSTCKSANPEIVYGASKLIAERMVLNEKGSVARFFNVVETSGNVFEIWNNIPDSEPIDLAPTCERHFISLDESVGLIIFCLDNEPGRYIVNSGPLIKMSDVAERLYPKRKTNIIAPRRGDRLSEKFLSTAESIESYFLGTEIIKVSSLHD